MKTTIIAFCSLALLLSGQTTQIDVSRQGKNVVSAAAGMYGDSTHTVQITIDSSGRITNLTQVGIQGNGTQSASGIGSGTFAAMSSFSSGLYIALDQPAGQQLYTCVNGLCAQVGNIGGSGALKCAGGSCDVNLAIVPLLTSANTFLGRHSIALGLTFVSTTPQPACSADWRGTWWYLNNGTSKDGVQVCVWNGNAYAWVSLL